MHCFSRFYFAACCKMYACVCVCVTMSHINNRYQGSSSEDAARVAIQHSQGLLPMRPLYLLPPLFLSVSVSLPLSLFLSLSHSIFFMCCHFFVVVAVVVFGCVSVAGDNVRQSVKKHPPLCLVPSRPVPSGLRCRRTRPVAPRCGMCMKNRFAYFWAHFTFNLNRN